MAKKPGGSFVQHLRRMSAANKKLPPGKRKSQMAIFKAAAKHAKPVPPKRRKK